MTSCDELVRFDVEWDDLDVTPLRVEQALGYVQGGAPDPLPEMIHETLGEAPRRLAISAGFRVLSPHGTVIEPEALVIRGTRFHTGRLIAGLVNTADRFAVVVATAGAALDDWVRSLSEQGDPLAAFIVDGLGTVVAEQAAARLRRRFPKIKIVGVRHGYFDKNPESAENAELVAVINQLRPNILIAGMGMPVQERWLMENWERLNVNVFLTGGAVFDYISGKLSRAPRWMTENGLEWLGRLLIEPRRLWKRYILGNPLFLWRVFTREILGFPLPQDMD